MRQIVKVIDPGIRRLTPKSSHVHGGLISGEAGDWDRREIVWKVEHWQPSCPGRHHQAHIPGQFSQRDKVMDEAPFLRGSGARGYDRIVRGIDDDHEEGILAPRGYHLSSFFQPPLERPGIIKVGRSAQE